MSANKYVGAFFTGYRETAGKPMPFSELLWKFSSRQCGAVIEMFILGYFIHWVMKFIEMSIPLSQAFAIAWVMQWKITTKPGSLFVEKMATYAARILVMLTTGALFILLAWLKSLIW